MTNLSDNPTATERFDLDELPAPVSGWRLVVKRIDFPVQLTRLVVLGLILLVWKLGVDREWVNRIFSASMSQVYDAITEILPSERFHNDLKVTLREAVYGFGFGATGGLIFGLILGQYRPLFKIAGPFLTFTNAAPKIVLAPVFILWFGVGETSKIVLAAIIVFFLVQIPTTAAVGLIDPDLDTVATSMGATQYQKFTKVVLPGILPAVFGALRLGVIYSILVVVFTEMLAAKAGIGLRVISAKSNFNMGHMFAYVVIISLVALIMNGLLGLVERRLLRWQSGQTRGQVISL